VAGPSPGHLFRKPDRFGMIRKIVTVLILVPLTVVIVMFAVANRQIITVSFDPFDSVQPAFAPKMPLFLLIFVLVGVGVVIGGIAAWLKQHKWRARARRAEADLRALREQLDRRHQPAPPVALEPPVIIPPAA
jgi:hypothetical protein